MALVNLAHVLKPALEHGYAVPGFVCLGWEDMRAFVTAAEEERAPVILQAGPGCREHTPLPILGRMFRYFAENASVPVVAHLDHGYSLEECRAALGEGFTSLMFDGSRLPLQQNIDATAAVAELAHGAGASCEGEIGFVGYSEGAASRGTDPEEASQFALQTGIDAMAVSVGNTHLQKAAGNELDFELLRHIKALTSVPLVIHGGSGVPEHQRAKLAASSHVSKFNIGTELRMVFGSALRQVVNADAARFDRIAILKETEAPMVAAAKSIFRNLGASGRVQHNNLA